MFDAYCKFCADTTPHEFVKSEVNEGIPVIYVKCTKCHSIHMYGFIGTEYLDEES